ncbi:MAG: pseudouridine synthase [Eubacteriales bacterium]|nr:pseudouridine synthase [Eubacteriales bacterium]
MYLPEQFLDRLRTLLGDDFENYLGSFDTIYGQTLRLNRLKTEPADFIRRFSCEPIPWCENGFYYKGEERLSLHPYYYAGAYYLQEPSAMAPAQFLPVEPGERVLDLCAAPGGKTTALAAKLGQKGVLVANDISASRCKALLKNMEMAGVKNAIITCESPQKLARRFQGYFDKILVDAPCSGEGMFRKEPAMAKEWTPELVEEYAALQKEILESAVKMLHPGGKILYSTCTYSPQENEQSVEYLITEHGFHMMPLPFLDGMAEGMPEHSLSGEESLRECRRFWSHRVKGEGQFAALLEKPGKAREIILTENSEIARQELLEDSIKEGKKESGKKSKKNARKKTTPKEENNSWSEEMTQFFTDLGWNFSKKQVIFIEERAFLLPDDLPSLQGIRQIRLDKYICQVSGASRSEVKTWLKKGRIMVDNQVEKDAGRKVSDDDHICIDGKEVKNSSYHYLMLHKPAGVVSATRDDKERTVLDLVMEQEWGDGTFGMAAYENVFPVGRLDKDTEGLLLLTDDGNLSHNLLSPKKHVDKCYFALLDGMIGEEDVKAFEEGLDIGDEKLTMPAVIRAAREEELKTHTPNQLQGYGVCITIKEGRFHQIKRMAKAVGKEVLYLKRLTMGPLTLDPDLKAGQCRPLSEKELERLLHP